MIRIDEIYNNVIWEWTKEHNRNSRIFYCDPPGTSDPSNLFNHGSQHIKETDYFFMHDQEPIHIDDIHTALFDDVIMRNDDIKPAPRGNIIVSERDSEFLERLELKYKWKSHYYFYHGWAALDWYRGYNRTFLIARASDRTPSKAFISPNRIVAGKRDHRVLFLYHVFRNSLESNHITCPRICPEENIDIMVVADKYKERYPDITNTFSNADLPYLFKDEDTQVMSSCWITNFNESADSLFYVPTETVYFGRRSHLTEKTFKPIALEMPFILVAPAGSLAYLKEYGFKTFGSIIDESYDNEMDDFKRLEKISDLLVAIDNMSNKEKQQLHRHCLPMVEHNYNHFYYGNFEKILWKELTNMMHKWK